LSSPSGREERKIVRREADAEKKRRAGFSAGITLAACFLFVHPQDFAVARRTYKRSPPANGDVIWENLEDQIIMGIISWIILGLIAGFIGSKIVNKSGSGILMDIVVGVVGAIVGGFIGEKLGLGGVTGFWDIWSWFLAIVGSIIVLLIYRAVVGRA
jgi:uncharacterized membrane protein YeaQ/YmgE (transglycosylase-associated protein family)